MVGTQSSDPNAPATDEARKAWLSKGICARAPELLMREPSSAGTSANKKAIAPPISKPAGWRHQRCEPRNRSQQPARADHAGYTASEASEPQIAAKLHGNKPSRPPTMATNPELTSPKAGQRHKSPDLTKTLRSRRMRIRSTYPTY